MKVCEQKQIFSIIATEVILNSSKTQKKGIYLQAGKSLSGMYFFFRSVPEEVPYVRPDLCLVPFEHPIGWPHL
jgi:hypothetical protein